MKPNLRTYSGLLKYCLLSILLATTGLSNAQTIWIGEESSNWFDALNWSNGLPELGNDAAIPTSPPGDFLPIIAQDISVDYIISNANALTIMANLTNDGSIINFEDGVISNHGIFQNNTIVDNDGEFLSFGTVINNGELDNSGVIVFDSGNAFYNEVNGVFYNYGPIQLVDTYFSNQGMLYLNGSTFQSSGEFENFGFVHNNGEFENLDCGIFKNFGDFDNQFIFNNSNIFYDEGNYSGNPVMDALTLRNNSGVILANHECTDADGWTHYSNMTDGKILLSIFTDGKDIGNIADQSLVIKAVNDQRLGTGTSNNLNNALYLDSDDWYLLNRYWMISSTSLDTTSMKVRFYFNETDYNDIQNAFPLSQDIKELVFYKLKGTENAYDPNIAKTEVNYFEPGNLSSLTSWYQNKVSFSEYAEIEVNGLNAAYSAGVKSWLGGTIPFQQSFNVAPNNQNKTVNIDWSTTKESMNQDYILQRSDDSLNFTDLTSIPASGNASTSTNYAAIDESPNLQTTNYYRLMLIRTDGSIRFSDIKEARFDTGEISIFPNPSSDELRVRFSDLEEGEVTLIIYDINGQLMFSDAFEVNNNVITENIYDKTKLAAGIYSLQIEGAYKNESYRFIKID